jgi:hypothetical protein
MHLCVKMVSLEQIFNTKLKVDMCHDLNGSNALEHWTQTTPLQIV